MKPTKECLEMNLKSIALRGTRTVMRWNVSEWWWPNANSFIASEYLTITSLNALLYCGSIQVTFTRWSDAKKIHTFLGGRQNSRIWKQISAPSFSSSQKSGCTAWVTGWNFSHGTLHWFRGNYLWPVSALRQSRPAAAGRLTRLPATDSSCHCVPVL